MSQGLCGCAALIDDCSSKAVVQLRLVEPGKPVQNAFVEGPSGRFRDERPNLHWVRSLPHAREKIVRGRNHHNVETLASSALPLNLQIRPESSV